MARNPVVGGFRVGPHGSHGYRRTEPGRGACPGGYPCTHWGVDLYPEDVNTPIVAPERCQIVAVRTSEGPGVLSGYGPGALRVVSVLPGLLGGWRVWHTLGHLDSSGVARRGFRVGQELAEGEPIAPVYAPASGRYRHLHWEIWTRSSVPGGDARAPFVVSPLSWISQREAAVAAAVVGGVLVGGVLSGGG